VIFHDFGQEGMHTQASNRGTLWKVVILLLLARPAWKLLQIGTYVYVLLIITSTINDLSSGFNIDDLEW